MSWPHEIFQHERIVCWQCSQVLAECVCTGCGKRERSVLCHVCATKNDLERASAK
jgi:hypothetical protein